MNLFCLLFRIFVTLLADRICELTELQTAEVENSRCGGISYIVCAEDYKKVGVTGSSRRWQKRNSFRCELDSINLPTPTNFKQQTTESHAKFARLQKI
jgi:hypothetical protein